MRVPGTAAGRPAAFEPERGRSRHRPVSADDRSDEKALPKQTVGLLTLPAGQPVHVALLLRNALVAQMPAAPGQSEVTFVLSVDDLLAKTATVRVRVVDSRGVPVPEVRVALNDAQTGGGGTKTDGDGRVTLQHLRPGRLDLEIWHRDLRGPPVEVEVPAGADLDLGDVTLLPGVLVELAFDNFGGKGGVHVNWLGTPPRAGWTIESSYHSVQNGPSTTASLFPGRYGLLATGAGGVAIVEIDTSALPSLPIRFDLQPGAALLVRTKVGDGAAQLAVYGRTGMLVHRTELRGTSEFSLRLPPGDYRAEIEDATGAVTRRTITLGPDGALLTIP